MKFLILNQTFYPDVVATAQYATDLARELARRGHEVRVITSRRAYDQADVQFAAKEIWCGIRIERIGGLGLGKKAKWRRALDFAAFLVLCCLRLLFHPKQDVVIPMTSPPLISSICALYTLFRGGALMPWVMDLNPDEAVAAGWLREKSPVTRLLNLALVFGLRRARTVVVLDRFMRERVDKKVGPGKAVVLPPWSLDENLHYDHAGREEFREQHGLAGKFVVMYAGNHSPCHSLDTLLNAARELSDDRAFLFCFVGGGSEFRKTQEFADRHRLDNIVCLPYQPREKLSQALSSADLHVAVLGEPFVGIVHPCKIYNIFAVGVPLLYIGPALSHITDLLRPDAIERWNFVAMHGDVQLVVRHVRAARRLSVVQSGPELQLAQRFSHSRLLGQMASIAEAAGGPRRPVPEPTRVYAQRGRLQIKHHPVISGSPKGQLVSLGSKEEN